MTKDTLQCNPDIAKGCETNNFGHGFFKERIENKIEDALVFKFPCLEQRIGVGGTISGGKRGLGERTIYKIETFLAFKQGNPLTLPKQIVAR